MLEADKRRHDDLMADMNYDHTDDIIRTCLREHHKQVERMLLCKLISTISAIEPECTEETIFKFLPKVQIKSINPFYDEYYYMLSAEKKQLLFSIKMTTKDYGITFEVIRKIDSKISKGKWVKLTKDNVDDLKVGDRIKFYFIDSEVTRKLSENEIYFKSVWSGNHSERVGFFDKTANMHFWVEEV